jgi:hypothetical protein
MSLYNVKAFKPALVILAGTPPAIEAAKAQGLKTHPQMHILQEPPQSVGKPGEHKPPSLPAKGTHPPTAAAAIEAAAAQADVPAAPEVQTTDKLPPPPHTQPTPHVATDSSNNRHENQTKFLQLFPRPGLDQMNLLQPHHQSTPSLLHTSLPSRYVIVKP